jgi:hypothetical protein
MKKLILIAITIGGLAGIAFGQDSPTALPTVPAPSPAVPSPPKRPKPALAPATPSAGNGFGGGAVYYSSPGGNFGAGGGVGSMGGSYGTSLSVSPAGSAGIPPVVVRFSGGTEERNAALEEDLTIMTHVIERAIQTGMGEDTPEVKSGISIRFSDSRSVRGLYLDGFGALFMIKVRFPVFAPNPPEAKDPTAGASADSEWDKTKRELYGEADARAGELALISGESQFDGDQVEKLKEVILQSLKNAANIRNLKPDDSIAVTVFGQPATIVQLKKIRSKPAASNAGQASTPALRTETAPSPKSSVEIVTQDQQKARATLPAREPNVVRTSIQGTVLALRVKKSDVDAFAGDKMDFEGFQKRAEQNSYPGSGYGITSINSWSRSGNSRGSLGQ